MWLVITLILPFVPAVLSYSNGPPALACESMTPSHGGLSPQTSLPNFNVTVNKDSYSPGEQISVTLNGCGATMFKGFMLQARRADFDSDTSTAVGTFDTPSGTRDLTCGADFGAVVHSDPTPKVSLTFTWTAPSTSVGHVVFTATFVEELATFWVKVNSRPVRDSSLATAVKPGQSTYPTPSKCDVKSTTQTLPTWANAMMGSGVTEDTQCGWSKGCMYECYGQTCKVGISWETLSNSNEVLFEMAFMTPETDNMWMAMGFSDDTLMGGDSVVECVMQSGSVRVYSSENSQYIKHNERVSNMQQLRNIGGGISNGVFKCSFAISRDTVNGQEPFYLLGEDQYVLFAYGKTYADSDEKRMHREQPLVAVGVNLLSTETYYFETWMTADSNKAANVSMLMLAAVIGIMFWRNY